MTALDVALVGAGIFLASGLLAIALPGRITAALAAVGGALVAGAGLMVLGGAGNAARALAWPVPGGAFDLLLDPIAALFLVPTGVLGGLGAVYATRYWRDAEHPEDHRRVRGAFGVLAASTTLVLLARDGVGFLAAWEVMAISAFVLVATDHRVAAVREAAYVFLLAAHAATLGLWLVFARIGAETGTFGFAPLPATSATTLTLVLGLCAFGLKAGFMPLHVWLPGAHASAPSHVSAFLSGVMLKVGIYGIVRLLSLSPGAPPGLGALVLLLGAVSAIGGVAFALGQHDLKRLLAYHSIENIGIILLGLGLALLGRSLGHPAWVVLGLAGAMLHVWNHAFFKGLLFLAAGSVVHATGTRQIDRLGGVAGRMPRTALLFLIGAAAICGLPSLNGFVSELMIYLGLFRSAGPDGAVLVALAAPVLALVGALAVACFVKVYGAVFLGEPRTEDALRARPAPTAMVLPVAALALLCATIGWAPPLVAPMLDRVVAAFAPEVNVSSIATLAPLGALSALGVALLLACALAIAWRGRAARQARRVSTWGCGYAATSARVQYTASSFADTLVQMFGVVLRPRTRAPIIRAALPSPADFETHVDDVVLVAVTRAAFRTGARISGPLRMLQGGRVQIYVLYVLLAIVALLATFVPLDATLESLWGP